MFGQTFDPHDLAIIGLLVVLEGVLSIDNALVLGLLAKRLPKHLQGKALTYGLVGAFVFRLIAIATAASCSASAHRQLLGGLYLVYVSVKHFFFESTTNTANTSAVGRRRHADPRRRPDGRARQSPERSESSPAAPRRGAGGIVPAPRDSGPPSLVIELTDIAFAIDSILAAIALVGRAGHPTAAPQALGRLHRRHARRHPDALRRRPVHQAAGAVPAVRDLRLPAGHRDRAQAGGRLARSTRPRGPHRVDFHDFGKLDFWIFWLLMIGCFGIGFIPKRRPQRPKGWPNARGDGVSRGLKSHQWTTTFAPIGVIVMPTTGNPTTRRRPLLRSQAPSCCSSATGSAGMIGAIARIATGRPEGAGAVHRPEGLQDPLRAGVGQR